jgi:hypothetical protein
LSLTAISMKPCRGICFVQLAAGVEVAAATRAETSILHGMLRQYRHDFARDDGFYALAPLHVAVSLSLEFREPLKAPWFALVKRAFILKLL